MKTLVRYVTAFDPPANVEFEISDASVEDAMNDLLDAWYSYCWDNNIIGAKIAYVRKL